MNIPAVEEILEIYLQPDEFYWGENETRIKTILGSCIAICMWHPQLKIGGMSHSLLPSRINRKDNETRPEARYVDEAVKLFLNETKKTSTSPADYRVKVFGGASALFLDEASKSVGQRNYDTCRSALSDAGFTIFSEHIGGTESRNVMLDLWSGETWLRRVIRS